MLRTTSRGNRHRLAGNRSARHKIYLIERRLNVTLALTTVGVNHPIPKHPNLST